MIHIKHYYNFFSVCTIANPLVCTEKHLYVCSFQFSKEHKQHSFNSNKKEKKENWTKNKQISIVWCFMCWAKVFYIFFFLLSVLFCVFAVHKNWWFVCERTIMVLDAIEIQLSREFHTRKDICCWIKHDIVFYVLLDTGFSLKSF